MWESILSGRNVEVIKITSTVPPIKLDYSFSGSPIYFFLENPGNLKHYSVKLLFF